MEKKILISLGDPNGIGTEIVVKALRNFSYEIRRTIEIVGLENSWTPHQEEFSEIIFHKIKDNYIPELGVISIDAGRIVLKTLQKAVELIKHHAYYKGLVTAPISKEAVTLAGEKNFIGHTDYLAQEFSSETEMIFWSPIWSVLLMTTHIPLNQVSQAITPYRLRTAIMNAVKFQKKYCTEGVIAVCGLNPHAGENGLIGKEEQEIFIPIIQEFQQQNYLIEGPFSADTIFRDAEAGKFPILISPYHDQALTAFKLLHFHDGINITFGLPFIRTSPDHGTAFNIAGSNSADPSGMYTAINFIQQFA